MSWVVPLVGCGGPAVSRCGHETRQHRVRGALFAAVFAAVLLAACGGGSGGNLTTSSEPEPGPPETGPLTATGDGDGENEEKEEKVITVKKPEEKKIVVNIQPDPEEESESEEPPQQQTLIEEESESEEEENNNEEQKIVVNIQPDNQEPDNQEPEEESESDNNNEEETPQQLTSIEEEVFEHRPSEEPKYPASPQQQNSDVIDYNKIAIVYPSDATKEHADVLSSLGGSTDHLGFDYWGTITGELNNQNNPLVFNFGSNRMDALDLEDRGKIEFPHPLPAKYYELATRLSQPSLYEHAEAKQAFTDYKNSIADKAGNAFRVKNLTAHYNGKVGGMYFYKGQPGAFESNANFTVLLNVKDKRNADNLMEYNGATIIGNIGTDITIGGDKFYGFIISHPVDTVDGRFVAEKPTFGYTYSGIMGNATPNVDHGTGTINGWFSNDGRKGTSREDMPTQLFGKIEVSGFSKNGESGEGNQLKAIFVTER